MTIYFSCIFYPKVIDSSSLKQFMTCWIGFCIGWKSSELNDIMCKTSKNWKKKGSCKICSSNRGEIDDKI